MTRPISSGTHTQDNKENNTEDSSSTTGKETTMMNPYGKSIERLLDGAQLRGPRIRQIKDNEHMAQGPLHGPDNNPSIHVTYDSAEGKTLVYDMHDSDSNTQTVRTLGLKESDLFDNLPRNHEFSTSRNPSDPDTPEEHPMQHHAPRPPPFPDPPRRQLHPATSTSCNGESRHINPKNTKESDMTNENNIPYDQNNTPGNPDASVYYLLVSALVDTKNPMGQRTQHQELLIGNRAGQYLLACQDFDTAGKLLGGYTLPMDEGTTLERLLNHPESSSHIDFTPEGTTFLGRGRWADEYRRSFGENDSHHGIARFTTYLDADVLAELDRRAKSWGLTHEQTIHRIITEATKQNGRIPRPRNHNGTGLKTTPTIPNQQARTGESRELSKLIADGAPLAHYFGETVLSRRTVWHDETLFLIPGNRYVLENGSGTKHDLVNPDDWTYTELTEREAFDWMIRQMPLKSETIWGAECKRLIRSNGLGKVLDRTINPLDPDTRNARRSVSLDVDTDLPALDRYVCQTGLSPDEVLRLILIERLM